MDKELEKIFNALKKDKDFADCTDEELLEVAKMELKSKDVKMYVAKEVTKDKPKKPRTVKISDEKAELFTDIINFLTDTYEGVTVLKDNKLIEVRYNDKIFKVDVIEQRAKKS